MKTKQQFDIYSVDPTRNNGRAYIAHPSPTILLGGTYITTIEADSAAHAVFIHASKEVNRVLT